MQCCKESAVSTNEITLRQFLLCDKGKNCLHNCTAPPGWNQFLALPSCPSLLSLTSSPSSMYPSLPSLGGAAGAVHTSRSRRDSQRRLDRGSSQEQGQPAVGGVQVDGAT